MKIAGKIRLALIGSGVAVLGLGLLDYSQSRRLEQSLQQLRQFAFAESRAVVGIRESLGVLRYTLTTLLDAPAGWPHAQKVSEEALGTVEAGFDRLHELELRRNAATAEAGEAGPDDPAGAALRAAAQRALTKFRHQWQTYEERMVAGRTDDARTFGLTTLAPAINGELTATLDFYITHLRLKQNEQIDRISQQSRQSLLLKLASGSLLITFAGLITVVLHRSVVAPLRELETEARRVASGEGRFGADTRRDDELGAVARAISGMLQALQNNTVTKTELETLLTERTRELRDREAQLQRKSARLSLALDALRTSIWEFDVSTGRMALDAGWSLMIGGPAEETKTSSRRLMSLVHEDDLAEVLEATRACISGEAEHYSQEHRVRDLRGDWIWVQSKGLVTARDRNGRAVAMLGTNTDITARKNAELAIAHELEFLAALNQTTVALLEQQAKAEILEALARQGALLLQSVQVEVALIEGDELVTHAYGGAKLTPLGQRVKRKEAVLSWTAIDTREPVIVDHYETLPNLSSTYQRAHFHAVAVFPILLGTRCLGVIGFMRGPTGQGYSTWEQQKGLLLAQLAALVIHNAEIYEDAVEVAEQRAHALLEHERTFRHFVEQINQGFYTADARSLFIYCNPAIIAVTGWSEQELIGSSSFRVVAPEDRSRVIRQYREWARGTETNVVCEFRVEGKTGHQLWVEQNTHILRGADGRVREFRNFLRDITERRKAEAAIVESEIRFKSVFEESPIPIILLSYPEGKITEINKACISSFGFTREEAIGRTTLELNTWADPADRDHYFKRLRDEGSVQGVVTRMRIKNGAIIDVIYNTTRIAIGGKSCLLSSLIDITAQKQAEAALRQSESQLRHAQKMESLGTLAGGIAHDFNNILTGILGHAQLALGDLAPTHPAHPWMEGILKSGVRAKNLVQQILTFSRKTESTRVPTRVQLVTIETVSLLRSTLPAMVRLETDVDPGCPPALADATQIHQIILNLCTNAWHALPENGGTITVSLRPRVLTEAEAAPLAPLQPGRHLLLSIRDNGRGMDAATLERIFEPFFTTKDAGKGTGLGLAVVHSIVTAHRGAISVQSSPGRGACFDVYLPALEDLDLTGASTPAVPLAVGRGESILVVDDEPASGTVIARLLERLGYKPDYCADPRLALEQLRSRSYTLLVTDLAMPGLPGDELAKQALAQHRGLPVLLLSGFIEPRKIDALRALGVREILHKPPAYAELAVAVDRCLNAS